MLQPNDFKIYNASAGAGKTYTLVREFIHLLLSKKDTLAFSKILAITFTNKAANEMKERVLKKIKDWSDGKMSAEEIKEIHEILQLNKEQVQQKAKQILTQILHNYSLFSVSTIDTFNLRLMRAFSNDLGLSMNFDVELNATELMEEAVNLLYADLHNQAMLEKVISDIALQNLSQDKGWDIATEVAKTSSKLYSDHFMRYMSDLNSLTLEELYNFRKRVLAQLNEAQEKAKDTAQKIIQTIKSENLTINDFRGGKSYGLPKFFQKILVGEYVFPSPAQLKSIEERKLTSSKASATAVFRIEQLFPMMEQGVHQSQHYVREINLLKSVYKTLNTISLYNEVEKKLNELKEENNLMLISEFNKIISRHVQEQPIPFIYEKIGTRYQHYFIDEFQDTSTLQWENLKPLIENAVSQNDTVMLVGDPKQSIYRFRGGNPQLMIDLVNDTTGKISVENLETNWRSYDEVIKFNNSFHTKIAKFIAKSDLRKIYQEGNQQKSNPKQGGYVYIELIEEPKTFKEEVLQKLLKKIKEAEQNHFLLSEMAILVRDNKEATMVAEFLKEEQIDIISDDSLLLNNSPSVQLLLHLFKVITDPENPAYRAKFLLSLYELKLITVDDFTNFALSVKALPFPEFTQKLAIQGINLDFLNTPSLSFYDQVERCIKSLKLHTFNQSYVLYFLDEILKFQNKYEASAQSFLNYWELNGDKKSINSPEGINALRLMTIHKSKGLQFPVVFLPFVDFSAKENGVWIPMQDPQVKNFYIQNLKQPEELPEIVRESVQNEYDNSLMDIVNILYVATTRAEEQLFIFSPLRNEESKAKTISVKQFVNEYVKDYTDNLILELGTPERKSEIKQRSLPYETHYTLDNTDWTRKVKISSEHAKFWEEKQSAATEYGKKIHTLLERTTTLNRVEKTLEEALREGLIKDQEKETIGGKIKEIFRHPLLSEMYQQRVSLNERDFISKEGILFRPDKLVKTNAGWALIDYKTGEPSEQHKKQLRNYKKYLEELGFPIKKTYLVYLSRTISVVPL